MRFRLGLLTGFASGYYLGSRAGRERYEQINRTLNKIKRSDAYEVATERARDVVDSGVARAKDLVGTVRHHNGDEPLPAAVGADPFLPPPSEPLP